MLQPAQFMSNNNFDVINCLIKLPQQILLHGNTDGIQELILKFIAEKNYFNLNKAAYFLDNPSFNCSKGIAGFDALDFKDDNNWLDLWDNNDKKIHCIEYAAYNQKIKKLRCNSLSKLAHNNEKTIFDFAKKNLEFINPSYLFSNGKHGNIGIFFYENKSKGTSYKDQYLFESIASILGLTHH